MANVLTAGNSSNGGTAISTDTSGTLNIVTGSGSGANAITIDASQNVAMTASQTIAGNLTVTGTITGTGGVSGGLGTGQTWQSVTRTSGTTYTNSTGKPIVVFVLFTTGNGGSGKVSVSGVELGTITGFTNASAQSYCVIVPPSATYIITDTVSPATHTVTELR
jgi:hypothetical protein